MPVDYQVVPIEIESGLDTKSDPKKVVSGKFLRAENCVFTRPGEVTKRQGYTALSTTTTSNGSLSSPKMVHGYNNELLCADSGSLYSWTSSGSRWGEVGNYVSTELTKNNVNQDFPVSGYSDSAVLNNYILYGWSTAEQHNSLPAGSVAAYSVSYYSIVDSSTGITLLGPVLITTDSSGGINLNPVRCVTLGGSVLAVLFMKADYSSIRIITFSFNANGLPVPSAAADISTGFSKRSITAGTFVSTFDVTQTTAGATIIYGTAGGIRIDNINTSGVSSANATVSDSGVNSGACGPYYICQASDGKIWAYWCDETDDGAGNLTGMSIVYAIYTSTLGSNTLSKHTVVAVSAPYFVSNMFSVESTSSLRTTYYGIYIANSTTVYGDQVRNVSASDAGVISPADAWYVNGAMPFGRPFLDSSTNYAIFLYRSAALYPVTGSDNFPKTPGQAKYVSEATAFVVKLSTTPYVVARFGSGNVGSQAVFETIVGFNPNISLLSGHKYVFAISEAIQEFQSDYYIVQESFDGGLQNLFSYYIDFNSQDSYKATNAGGLALLNGGVIQCYDGKISSEWGFHLYPEITSLVQSGTMSGAIVNGLYSYIAVYQWTDNQGNLHQSATSIPASITTSGMNNTVTIKVSNYYLTQKTINPLTSSNGVSVAIYRTTASGIIYYLLTDPVFVLSAQDSSSSQTVSFTDIFADTSITGNPQSYTSPSSSVLENSTPPPSMALIAHNDRLFFRNDESRNNVWYTKSFTPKIGLSPSAFMTEDIDPKYGNIAALAEMDEKLVFLKDSGIMVQSGDGVDDTGQGSSFSFPQIVPSDVGCNSLKSVILTPEGVIFKSPNGIYILGRSLQVAYVGAEVEQYNSQNITGASLVPGKSQIRFLTSSGSTIVYDYIFKQWATFTNHTGTSSSTWNSTYVYANNSANKIYQESSTSYLDDSTAYSLLLQTSWLHIGAVQGFQRVKRFIMLGDYVNGNSASHKLSVSAAYDFSTTFQTAITYAFGAISSSGVFEYRERLPQQKCATISLLIQETTTGSSLETIDLTNMSFEAGLKRGVNKLGGLQSVG